ncbi:MAG: Arginyl-tRNA synthetase [Chlorobi bacterium]|nr:Arginyl-tRNA synthetase [Chlorobiota bacterium]
MKSLLATLSSIFGDAFEANGIDRALGEVVVSQRPELGQFQCNGALPAAKQTKANPRVTAQAVLDSLGQREIFADLSLAGPGFINITLTDEYLRGWINRIADDPRVGSPTVPEPKNVIIDFGGPNVAKAMHVGHLRSTIIGDSLQRLFHLMGERVTSDVHLGDWGTQMGMLITELKRRQPDLIYFDPEFTGPYPAEPPITIDDLEAMYPEASARCKEDAVLMEEARQATVELQRGRPGYFALWRHFANISATALKRDFGSLGVNFDLWLGESDVQPLIPEMVERLKSQGFVEESQGAQVIHLPPEAEGKELQPLILVKSDGGVMYGTTDLATIQQRVQEFHADQILYVVDGRQEYHFRQLFSAARLTGIAGAAELEHVPFGTMNGPDGRPFKTRAGGVMKLQLLIQMAQEQAALRMKEADIAQDYSEEERLEIARLVGIAAIKYADLMNHRTSDSVFDPERFTRFEGRTGAYLLYAAVRIKSILRKAEERGFGPGPILAPGDRERDLLMMLFQLPEALQGAYERRAPNFLCEFVYNLAQSFNRFYQNCRILPEENVELRASWLALARLCLLEMELVLRLLGIEVPERM